MEMETAGKPCPPAQPDPDEQAAAMDDDIPIFGGGFGFALKTDEYRAT